MKTVNIESHRVSHKRFKIPGNLVVEDDKAAVQIDQRNGPISLLAQTHHTKRACDRQSSKEKEGQCAACDTVELKKENQNNLISSGQQNNKYKKTIPESWVQRLLSR